jgi:WD40 repeat protein
MRAPATMSAVGSRATARSRRRAGLALLVGVTLIGTILGYRWWTNWPVRLELGEDHGHIPVAFSPDGATLATMGFRSAGLRFWDAARGRLRASWTYPHAVKNHAVDGAFSPDGRTFAAVWIAQHPPGTETLSIDLIDVSSGRSRVSIPALSGRLTGNIASCGPVFAADGRSVRLVAGTGGRGQLLDFDVATGRVLAGHPVSLDVKWYQMALSPDGRKIAAYSYATSPVWSWSTDVTLWDVERDREVARLCGRAGGPEVTELAFSGDGKTLGVGRDDGSIELWDVATNDLRGRLPGHQLGFIPRELRLSHDGSIVASRGHISKPAPNPAYVRLRLNALLGYYRDEGGRPETELLVFDAIKNRCLGRAAWESWPVLSRDGGEIASMAFGGGTIRLRDVARVP